MPARLVGVSLPAWVHGTVAPPDETSLRFGEEVLRLWLLGEMGLRPIAEMVGVDRKTVRRYIDAAVAGGLVRDGGVEQLTDGLLGGVIEAVRPARPAGHGAAWEACRAEHDRIKVWLDKRLNLTKVEDLRARRREPREVFVARVPRLARASGVGAGGDDGVQRLAEVTAAGRPRIGR